MTKGARKRFKRRIINSRDTSSGQGITRDQNHTFRGQISNRGREQNSNRGREQNSNRNHEPQSNRGRTTNQK